jgi:hypothetical protein
VRVGSRSYCSALSDVTILEAGLYTPAPGDCPRFLGGRLIDQVRHVMVFPYDSVGGTVGGRRTTGGAPLAAAGQNST